MDNQQGPPQGTPLSVMRQPGREGSVRVNGKMGLCGQVPLLSPAVTALLIRHTPIQNKHFLKN